MFAQRLIYTCIGYKYEIYSKSSAIFHHPVAYCKHPHGWPEIGNYGLENVTSPH